MTPVQQMALRISELKAMVADSQKFEEVEGVTDPELRLFKELLRVERRAYMAITSDSERKEAMKWVDSYLDDGLSAPVPADAIIAQLRRKK